MTVPITSDLAGYQEYWTHVIEGIAVVVAIVILELGAILWRVWKK